MTHAGLGKHFVTLTLANQVTFFKVCPHQLEMAFVITKLIPVAQTFFIFEFLYAFSMTLVKFSIVLFYLRIFNIKRSMRFTLYVISIFLIMWFLAQFIYILMECRPIRAFWDWRFPPDSCNADNHVSGYSLNGASLVLDLAIFLVPILPLWGLKRSLASRLCVIGVFMVGAL